MDLLNAMIAQTSGWATDDERFADIIDVLEYLDGLVAAIGLTTGDVLLDGAADALGYTTGAGGAVTQITSATTGVTLSKPTGQITTVSLDMAAAAEATFVVTNTLVAATDVVVISPVYGGAGTPLFTVSNVAAGSFSITVTNLHASTALNAVAVINFVVLKGVAA